MTAEEFMGLGLPVEADGQLYVEAGLEWLKDHTTLGIDLEDMESIKALSSSARLFLVKYCEICTRDIGVTGESVGPLSQSFTADLVSKQTAELARQLLGPYLKANVAYIPCSRRWR